MSSAACFAIAATDARVGVAGGVDGDAGGEVEEDVAVDVLDGAAVAAHGDDRVGAREAGAGPGVVELDVGAGPGARQLGHDVRHGTRLERGAHAGDLLLAVGAAPRTRRRRIEFMQSG